ncbi:MAG: glutamate-1-semialdehyde-2,1-aminomutase [Flavobacteriaceae bacterium]|nr:MAG: glutamate-1-semialdehyde-2,1-aminomutase [Flavobacteriaceae bacterium]
MSLYTRSSALFLEAQKSIPGGVNSPVRAFKSVGGTPIFIQKAAGAYLYCEDQRSYIDYINSWGPMILGHNHPRVIEKIKSQLNRGTSFGTPTELETQMAEKIVSMVPGIDKVRMVNSGTEACMSAIRLARGYTEREKIIKFEGCYHGHSDAFLIQAGSGAATFGSPNSPGVTKGTAKDTLLATYNDLESVARLIAQNPDQIAAIILEPVAGNMGCVLPDDKFLPGLRQLCDKHKILLIFDEVMTGFRLALGGAQEKFGVLADIVTFGKIIGGGLPVGAFAARKEIMDFLSPLGPVYQAGTLSGNPIAMSAGLETLTILEETKPFEALEKTTEKLHQEIEILLKEKGVPYSINRLGSMFSVFFSSTKVVDFETAKLANNPMFSKFFHNMLENGVYLPPSSFETWFISTEIKDLELDKTLTATQKALSNL